MVTLEQYLRPDASLRPPVPTPRLWTPPAPTRATLLPPTRSRGSARGGFNFRDRAHVFHSGLERTVGYVLATRHDTLDLWDQPPAVTYVGDDGAEHRHTFDWLVTRGSGTKVAIAVKPKKRVESSGIQRVLALCAEQISSSFADELLLVTEKHITKAEKFNADLIHHVQRMTYPDDDAVIDALIGDLKGIVTIGSLVAASELKGWGFGAAVRAIADRRLVLISPGRIDYETPVRSNLPPTV
jgi:hypothetical protein